MSWSISGIAARSAADDRRRSAMLPRSEAGAPGEARLAGLSAGTPLEWWAGFGAFVAACELDAAAALRFDDGGGERWVPVITTTASLEQIVARMAATPDLITEAAAQLPGLLKTHEQLDLDVLQVSLARLRKRDPHGLDPAHRLIEAVTWDGADHLVAPWFPSNSNGLAVAQRAAAGDDLAGRLAGMFTDRTDPRQWAAGNVLGMAENMVNTAMLTGLGDNRKVTVRLLAMVAVVYGLQALCSVSEHFVTVLGNGRWMSLPVPSEPVSLATMLALMRSGPLVFDAQAGYWQPAAHLVFTRGLVDRYFFTWRHVLNPDLDAVTGRASQS